MLEVAVGMKYVTTPLVRSISLYKRNMLGNVYMRSTERNVKEAEE